MQTNGQPVGKHSEGTAGSSCVAPGSDPKHCAQRAVAVLGKQQCSELLLVAAGLCSFHWRSHPLPSQYHRSPTEATQMEAPCASKPWMEALTVFLWHDLFPLQVQNPGLAALRSTYLSKLRPTQSWHCSTSNTDIRMCSCGAVPRGAQDHLFGQSWDQEGFNSTTWEDN